MRKAEGLGLVPRLHVLTDETIQNRYSHLELALMASRGGADAVQLREKRACTTRSLIELALSLRDALAASSVRLIINDRVDVAAAADVRAVHLGRDDVPPAIARSLLGEAALIGATANSLDEALGFAASPVDYLGVGPVFGTQTKINAAPALGLARLADIVAAVDKPVIAIGHITPEDVPELFDCGVWGVAVTRAVVAANEPEYATRSFRRAIDAWLEKDHKEFYE